MGQTMSQQEPLVLRFATAWLLLVPVAAIVEFATYSPPYSWLADWIIVHIASTVAPLALVVVTMALLAPAVLLLRRYDRAHPVAAAAPLEPQAARRVVVRVMLVIAAIATVCAAATWLVAQSLPQRSDPPVPIDLPTLGDRAPPLASVIVTGTVDPHHRAYEQLKLSSIGYAPFATSGGPVRFFLDHPMNAFSGPEGTLATAPVTVRGVLVLNGLPQMIKRDFELRGVRIASPYYLLRTGRDGARGSYYIATGLLGLIAALTFGLAIVASVANLRERRARKRSRDFANT